MSLFLGVLSAAVTLDDSDYRKKLSGLEGASDNTFKRIAKFAAGYLTGRALFGFVQDGVQAFANLETASWNFNQVFKEIPAEAAVAEAKMRSTYKLSETTSKTLLSNAADQLQSFGFSVKQSLEYARQVSERGIDLASFKGGNQAEAVAAITKALTGETEGLKRYGIVVQQGSKQFQEMVASIQQTTGCTELQAKAQAILNEIMEKSKNAAGDYTKEGSTIAQQQMDIAEATIKAKEAFGAFLAEGASPLMETWRQVLVGFAETSPEMQRLEIRTAAVSVAFLTLAKTGAIARANIAFSGTVNGLAAASTHLSAVTERLAARGVVAGKAHVAMAMGMKTVKVAANELAAALGPIGAAMIVLSAAYLAYSYLMDKNNKALEADLSISKERADAANAEVEANQKIRDRDVESLARLEELSKYERLNNSEKKEAEQLIKNLASVYGNLDISIDKTTGKLKIGANAWRELNSEQAKAAGRDLTRQVNAQSGLVTAQMNNLRNDLSSFWKNTVFASGVAGVANLFGSDDNTDGDLAYRAKNSERQQELDRIMKLRTAEEQLAGLENMRNSLLNESDKKNADKVQEVINALKKQIELEKQLEAQRKKSKETQPNQKPAANNKDARTQSEAERRALNSLEQKEWGIKFNASDSSQQVAMLDQKINDVFIRQSGKYSSLDAFKNADRSSMTEQELRDLQEIVQLEQKREAIRKRSADAFKGESDSYQKFLRDRSRRDQENQVEREIKNAEKRGDKAGVDAIVQREYDRAKQSAEKLQREYEQAVKDAQADSILTEEEKKKISSLRSEMQRSMSDEDKWKNRIVDKNDDQQKDTQKTFGSFSAAMLDAMLGASSPEQEIAKNTKDQLRLTRQLIENTEDQVYED